ncbi:disease resistance protein Roq1 [Populus alba]|nr:disease resistance protein RPV1-like [Populus alba]
MASVSFESHSSSSSSSRHGSTYDVFLSFRGADTRNNFTDHLYAALDQAGVYTFRDGNELPPGQEISPQLSRAIRESRISVVVFSKGYASSRWCLDELVKILECRHAMGQVLVPIFYDIDPSYVRKQKWNVGEALKRKEEDFEIEMERLKRWREALDEAGNISGWILKDMANGYESKFIQKIVEDVLHKLGPKCLDVAKYPVGIESRVDYIIDLLSIHSKDVRVVGVYGMPGIGKTTIAKAVFNQLCHGFEGSSFISNVKEKTVEQLQEQLLCDILKPNTWKIDNVSKGVNLMKDRFRHKRVFVVLDDVDQLKQLEALVRERNCLGPGSRVVITARDEHLLTQIEVDGKYHVKELHQHESLQLFSLHAFKDTHPEEDYVELSNAIVDYAGGVPLALEVLGSYLFRRNISVWKSAIKKLRKIPNRQIQKTLRISFDTLDDDKVKAMFLDIACFFIGWDKEYVVEILDGRGFFPDIGIDILIQRSLLSINDENELNMHDLIRDMGREIAREVSYDHPGKRNRIWLLEDALDVLNNQTGTDAVEGLALDVRASTVASLSTKSFTNMRHLKLLQINGAHLAGSYKLLPKELIWLCWLGCPMKSLPSDLQLNNLVVLDLQHSNIQELWKGTKILNKLKILNLSYSKLLVKTPNFQGLPSLEILKLTACTSLAKVHPSIGHLKRLVSLDLEGCCRLKTLPESICNLKSIETLNISLCSQLEKLPEFLGDMESLTELLANGTAIKQLPASTGYLKKLTRLSLVGYGYKHDLQSRSWFSRFSSWLSWRSCSTSIAMLPTPLTGLTSLKELDISYCGLPEASSSIDIGSLSCLEKLNLSGSKFSNLPSSIGHLLNLKDLWLRRCPNLFLSTSELPLSLTRLYACICSTMERVPVLGEKRLLVTSVGCLNLIEFRDKELLDTSSSILNFDDCNDLSNNYKETLAQELFKGEMCEISFSASEIPEWFSFRGEGSSLSFHLPSVLGSDGNQLQGLLIGVVFATSLEGSFAPCRTLLRNKSNGKVMFERSSSIKFDPSSTRNSWILSLPLIGGYRCAVKGVEELELNVEISSSGVEQCGVHLITKNNAVSNIGKLDRDIYSLARTDTKIVPSYHHQAVASSSPNEWLESCLTRELQRWKIYSAIRVSFGMDFIY